MTNTLATTTTDIRQPHTHSKQIKLELIHKFYGDSLILQREWQHRCYWSCKYYVLSTCSGANFFFSIFIHLWQFTVAQSVGSSIDTLFFTTVIGCPRCGRNCWLAVWLWDRWMRSPYAEVRHDWIAYDCRDGRWSRCVGARATEEIIIISISPNSQFSNVVWLMAIGRGICTMYEREYWARKCRSRWPLENYRTNFLLLFSLTHGSAGECVWWASARALSWRTVDGVMKAWRNHHIVFCFIKSRICRRDDICIHTDYIDGAWVDSFIRFSDIYDNFILQNIGAIVFHQILMHVKRWLISYLVCSVVWYAFFFLFVAGPFPPFGRTSMNLYYDDVLLFIFMAPTTTIGALNIYIRLLAGWPMSARMWDDIIQCCHLFGDHQNERHTTRVITVQQF